MNKLITHTYKMVLLGSLLATGCGQSSGLNMKSDSESSIEVGRNDALSARPALSLYDAVKSGNLDLVVQLLDEGVEVNRSVGRGKVRTTLLNEAASKGYTQIAQVLVAAGANITARDQYGGTPLHNAAYTGGFEVLSFLLEAGAAVNAQSDLKRTPLHYV